MCVCVCACVCVCECVCIFNVYVCVHACARVRVRSVCARARVCACTRACVCVHARARSKRVHVCLNARCVTISVQPPLLIPAAADFTDLTQKLQSGQDATDSTNMGIHTYIQTSQSRRPLLGYRAGRHVTVENQVVHRGAETISPDMGLRSRPYYN